MSERDSEILSSSHDVINIIVIIDTDLIIRKFKDKPVSQDSAKPTQIGHEYSYMVATSESVIKGSGTADLHIKASVGDVIRWTGISESGNFDSSVLVYGLPKFGGVDVFKNTVFDMYKKKSMLPNPNSGGPFPVTFTEQSYWFIQASISNTGTEAYQIRFGLYHRPDKKEQKLFGYFQWDPKITVED
ncbi:inclusion body family protein [Pectobacterium sp. CHL-2024]|uniref:inclusion body family protein n=1 Tax=Pectobacterium sp. CHL-2024 TaxID=3377079 RepID=UPI003828F81E